jgi:hypothetical protein
MLPLPLPSTMAALQHAWAKGSPMKNLVTLLPAATCGLFAPVAHGQPASVLSLLEAAVRAPPLRRAA